MCSGWWFIVIRQNRWSSASVTVFAGQCSYTSPTWNSSRYRPYWRAPEASRSACSVFSSCFSSLIVRVCLLGVW
jgi:hypothetical protein